jgi:hypothetical protein
VELGKRYVCSECGQEFLCVRPGTGTVECCGKPVTKVEPKRLPASD